jgi:23S rRNA pseudouridine2605 synthase
MAEQRLQKFLAEAGIASRRKAETLIVAGRIQVNGKRVTELGTKVDPERDLVAVDGTLVTRPEEKSYFLLYKPSGCVTTASDPEGRPTALEYLRGVDARVFAVGRLDYDAEGALLFTDDGELANRLAHPRYGHRRVYLVKVKGDPPAEALERMKTGVRLEDGPAQALEAAVHEHAERNVWVRIVVGEGRFHLVKRLCEAVGLQIQRLFRPEFAGVTVEGLRPGRFRPLTGPEVHAMRQLVGLAQGTPPALGRRLLPKAARRHGHGPPPPPGSSAPAAAAEPVEDGRGPEDDAPPSRPAPVEAARPTGRGAPAARSGAAVQQRWGGRGARPARSEPVEARGPRGARSAHPEAVEERGAGRGKASGARPTPRDERTGSSGRPQGPRGRGGPPRDGGGRGQRRDRRR